MTDFFQFALLITAFAVVIDNAFLRSNAESRKLLLSLWIAIEEPNFARVLQGMKAAFLEIMDSLYGANLLSLRRFVASAVSSVFFIVLAIFVTWNLGVGYYAIGGDQNDSTIVGTYGVFFNELVCTPIGLFLLIQNVFLDYLSLAQTRWILRRSPVSSFINLGLFLVLDISLTACIVFIPLTFEYYAHYAHFGGVLSGNWGGQAPTISDVIAIWGSADGERQVLTPLVYSTFGTSILFYVFCLFSSALLIARRLARISSPVVEWLFSHPQPFTATVAITGAVLQILSIVFPVSTGATFLRQTDFAIRQEFFQKSFGDVEEAEISYAGDVFGAFFGEQHVGDNSVTGHLQDQHDTPAENRLRVWKVSDGSLLLDINVENSNAACEEEPASKVIAIYYDAPTANSCNVGLMTFSADGQHLVHTDERHIIRTNLNSGESLVLGENRFFRLVAHPDDNHVVLAASLLGIEFIDIRDGSIIEAFPSRSWDAFKRIGVSQSDEAAFFAEQYAPSVIRCDWREYTCRDIIIVSEDHYFAKLADYRNTLPFKDRLGKGPPHVGDAFITPGESFILLPNLQGKAHLSLYALEDIAGKFETAEPLRSFSRSNHWAILNKFLLSGGSNREVRLFDVGNYQLKFRFQRSGQLSYVSALRVSEAAGLFLVGGLNGGLWLFRLHGD